MRRLLLALALLAAIAAPPASAARADRCQRHAGEQLLASSAQATVVAKARNGRQTLTGCSRRTGRRHAIAVLGFQNGGGRTRLVGLRLAGTRIAYVVTNDRPNDTVATEIIADDALHGGRLHEVASLRTGSERLTSWAVDAEGDVAWVVRADDGISTLRAWRSGLGVRQVDDRADLRDVRLAEGVLRWRRNGARKSVDLAAVPISACIPRATQGTLEVDMYGNDPAYPWPDRVCLRATGRSKFVDYFESLVDVNGSRLVFSWQGKVHSSSSMTDLATGETTVVGRADGSGDDAVYDAAITDGGSVAWIDESGFWARDAAGTRAVPGVGRGRSLSRDGSTVTWPGGPSVVLNP